MGTLRCSAFASMYVSLFTNSQAYLSVENLCIFNGLISHELYPLICACSLAPVTMQMISSYTISESYKVSFPFRSPKLSPMKFVNSAHSALFVSC